MFFHRVSIWSTLMLTILMLLISISPTFAATNEELTQRIEKLEEKIGNEARSNSDNPLAPYINDVGGRMQFDATFNTDDSDSLISTAGNGNRLEDGSEFRRLRFYFSGNINQFVDYKFQTDVSNSNLSVQDAYINFHDLPWVGNILVGRYYEDFTLDENTSSKYLTFMTRSMLSDAFQQSWNNGVQWRNHYLKKRLNLTLNGYFTNDNEGSSNNTTGGRFNVSGRVTIPLFYNNNGREVLHLGSGYALKQPGNNNDTFSSGIEPEVHQTDDFIEVSIPNVDSYDIYNLELAGVKGPLSAQTEYAELELDRLSGNQPDLDAWYAQASFFLTGEVRPYSPSKGGFGRVKPSSPFFGWKTYRENGGPGAWELALRQSNMDYSSARNVTRSNQDLAADLDVTTAGLNWYPNAHTRWMLNYVDANQDRLGDANYLTTRFQVDF